MAARKTKHKLLRAVLRDDGEHPVGSDIELTKEEAANMAALGMIEGDKSSAPAAEAPADDGAEEESDED